MIKKRSWKVAFMYVFIAFMMVSYLPIHSVGAASEEEITHQLKGRGFKEEVNLGVPASGAVLTSAVFGEENGRKVGYTTANGGKFSAVDVVSNEVLFTEDMPGVTSVWSHSVAPNGSVYIAALAEKSAGTLWRYTPEEEKLEKIGTPDASHQFWTSTTDEAGNIYIGTYKEKEGKIFKYDPLADSFTDFGVIDTVGQSSYVRSIAYHEGYIYAGLGQSGAVYKIKADDPTDKEDITKNVTDILGMTPHEMGFAYDMAVVDNYLYVRFNEAASILFYDLVEEKWVEDKVVGKRHDGSDDDFGSFGFTQIVTHEGKAYVIHERKLLEIDTETLEMRDTGIAYAAAWRGMTFADYGEKAADIRLVTFQRGAFLFIR